jgi:hypothetical protein
MSRLFIISAIATGSVLMAGSAVASSSNSVAARTYEIAAARETIFSPDERRIIRDVLDVMNGDGDTGGAYHEQHGKPGKGGKGKGAKGLPPGIAQKLARGGTLPPGLAKRDLPADLERRLPPVAAGTERQIVGNDVVLIEKGTNLILDIIRDVVHRN